MTTAGRLQQIYTACIYFTIGYIASKHSHGDWGDFFIELGIILAWRFTAWFMFKPKYKSSTGV